MLERKKAHLLEVVELLDDLPEYGLKTGALWTVVEVSYEHEEPYMVEFVNETGDSSRMADSVRPDQIKVKDGVA